MGNISVVLLIKYLIWWFFFQSTFSLISKLASQTTQIFTNAWQYLKRYSSRNKNNWRSILIAFMEITHLRILSLWSTRFTINYFTVGGSVKFIISAKAYWQKKFFWHKVYLLLSKGRAGWTSAVSHFSCRLRAVLNTKEAKARHPSNRVLSKLVAYSCRRGSK